MRIVVYGAGGAGGRFGAQLALAGHDVTFIARGSHLAAIQANGQRLGRLARCMSPASGKSSLWGAPGGSPWSRTSWRGPWPSLIPLPHPARPPSTGTSLPGNPRSSRPGWAQSCVLARRSASALPSTSSSITRSSHWRCVRAIKPTSPNESPPAVAEAERSTAGKGAAVRCRGLHREAGGSLINAFRSSRAG